MTEIYLTFIIMAFSGTRLLPDRSKPLPTGIRVSGHILFWIGVVIYEGLILSQLDGEYTRHLVISLIELPIKVVATYFTLFILIDKFLVKTKYGMFALLLLLSMALFGIAFRIMSYYIVYPLYFPDGLTLPLFYPPKLLIHLFSIYSLTAIVATFHLMRHWYKHQQAVQRWQRNSEQFEKEKLAAELKLLKSQINPHFLFNTLNNLYTLTLHQSDKSPEVVYKLSQLMSYMLYDSNQAEVPLEKEVNYIQNYIALEKIRYTELDVSMNVFDDVRSVSIAPLLILPFVENSFKHGVSNQLARGWIRIDILLQDGVLVIKVENSKEPHSSVVKKTSGIGLINVKKRLELIYPGNYTLQIIDDEELYLVILKIDLSGQGMIAKEMFELNPEEDEVPYR